MLQRVAVCCSVLQYGIFFALSVCMYCSNTYTTYIYVFNVFNEFMCLRIDYVICHSYLYAFYVFIEYECNVCIYCIHVLSVYVCVRRACMYGCNVRIHTYVNCMYLLTICSVRIHTYVYMHCINDRHVLEILVQNLKNWPKIKCLAPRYGAIHTYVCMV